MGVSIFSFTILYGPFDFVFIFSFARESKNIYSRKTKTTPTPHPPQHSTVLVREQPDNAVTRNVQTHPNDRTASKPRIAQETSYRHLTSISPTPQGSNKNSVATLYAWICAKRVLPKAWSCLTKTGDEPPKNTTMTNNYGQD